MAENSTKMNAVQVQIHQSYQNELNQLADICSKVGASQGDADKFTHIVEQRNQEILKHTGSGNSAEILQQIENQSTRRIQELEDRLETQNKENSDNIKYLKEQITELQKKK